MVVVACLLGKGSGIHHCQTIAFLEKTACVSYEIGQVYFGEGGHGKVWWTGLGSRTQSCMIPRFLLVARFADVLLVNGCDAVVAQCSRACLPMTSPPTLSLRGQVNLKLPHPLLVQYTFPNR